MAQDTTQRKKNAYQNLNLPIRMLRYNNAWGRVNENDADIEQHLDRMYNRRIIDEWNGQFSLTNDEQIGGGIRVQGVVDMMTPWMGVDYNPGKEETIWKYSREYLERRVTKMEWPVTQADNAALHQVLALRLNNVDEGNRTITRYRLTETERTRMIIKIITTAKFARQVAYQRWANRDRPEERKVELYNTPHIGKQCFLNTVGGIKYGMDETYGTGPENIKQGLINHAKELKTLKDFCLDLNPWHIVSNSKFGNHGNCMMCFGIGEIGSRCARPDCNQHMLSGIVRFKNRMNLYINPWVIHFAIYRDICEEANQRIVPTAGQSNEAETILPLRMDEIISNGKCPCVFKLLYHAYMYCEANTSCLVHVMNEVVMTFDVIGEVLNIMTDMKRRLEKLHEASVEYDRFLKLVEWYYGPWVRHDWYMEVGLYTMRPEEQQERDGENRNLVPAGNENADGARNNRRNRDEDTDEERRVRARRG